MPNLRGSEWLIIILLVVLLFGAKRLPDAARSVGRSLRIFKAETKGLVEDGSSAAGSQGAAPSAAAPSAATPTPSAPVALPTADPAVLPKGLDPQASALHPQAEATPSALNPQPPSQS